jgi:hypothetical protein
MVEDWGDGVLAPLPRQTFEERDFSIRVDFKAHLGNLVVAAAVLQRAADADTAVRLLFLAPTDLPCDAPTAIVRALR